MAVVHFEVDNGIGTIRLDRPPMNAINSELTGELRAAAGEATTRADVRAVVIYGGPKVFAAGADIKEMAPMGYAEILAWVSDLTATFEQVARIPKPVVAAVTGYALGGGLELALCADFRVFGDNAKVGLPEILLGVIPGAGGTQRLPRLIGAPRAKDLIYTGRQVRAPEAKEIGLADRVVAPDDVYTEAVRLAGRFVDGPALALRAAKRAIDDGLDLGLSEGQRLETALFAGLFGTEDKRIGMDSFVERGPGKADFIGR
ncbi:enoyl-CoA hydratase-related protein [Frankia sp. Cppng1_Ct_nod]|uniref:enoyl-CoA hydratase/isomerase family protein n=1 Tax=Frankia sp. Cppng1_Ct_nod TaxID=2897162 RepID=UPI001041A97B|nr:enoyl-CoA hydratase-related protein [Frankia sp. Cppng1_Ct_nod]